MVIDANNGQIRFGIFELDPRTRELRRNGVLVKLQDQPFLVLLTLLERPGELVTREELEKRVWPDDTIVDFEVGLSRAVNKLREALGDTAENPRFIQTLPRRGYRFIAPVENGKGVLQPADTGIQLKARRRWWLAAPAVAVAGLAVVAVLHFLEKPPAPALPSHFQLQVSESGTAAPFLSPDGRKVAYCVGGRLWVRFLESGESRDLAASEPGVPFWSPDSQSIGYNSALGKLKKIEVAGGLPQAVTDLRSRVWRGGAWNKDDIIIFGDGRVGLFRVSASGGVPVQITSLDFAQHETAHYCPSFLPDGRHFVYTRSTADEGKSAIYLGSVDATPEQQSTKPLVASNSQPVYVPSEDPDTGYLLYVRGGDLVAHPFDNSRLEMKGQAATVARKIIGDIPGAILVRFSASANGVLTFSGSNLFGERLTWFDREGKFIGTAGEPGLHATFSISPNGAYVAAEKNFGKADETDLWLLDLSRGGASTRFTFGSLRSKSPVWSPDGSRIIFCSNRDGTYNLYQKLATGVNDEEVLLKSSEDKVATSWSRDGRYLLYTVAHPKSKADIWVLPLQGGRKPVPFLRSNFNESHARFSPDGRWVAYTSDETGQDEIYVRSISMNTAGTAVETGGKWPISNRSGSDPRWRGDGRELYYRSRGGELLAVEIATHAAFRAGNPKTLGPLLLGYFGYWDSAADGSRFLSLANKGGPQTYSVVLNWQAGLKK